MQLGLMSLGDLVTDPVTGTLVTPAERHRMIVETAVVADQAGFYSINIGEHHMLEYIYSAPPVILAAIAERTTSLRLGTAVALFANLDPVRIAEDYATLDCLSAGRVDMVAGRGNFFASTYTLFGQTLDESRGRFDEAVELVCRLWTQDEVDFPGGFRPPIHGAATGNQLQPTPVNRERCPLWIGGGSSPETALLAAKLGLDLMLPSAFGSPEKFRPVVELYREAFAAEGHAHASRVGACWHVGIGGTSQQARQQWEPRYRGYHSLMKDILARVNPDLPNFFKPFDFDWLSTEGPAICGSPDEIVERLGRMGELLEAEVNLLYMDMGGMPPGELLDSVELVGSKVLPQLTSV
jgi:alkanesulfonate monooxygenase SsuD/methylene tetrahydromethanopterin reductase-like flavin-dependent oxidoreductase (luciferase family)